MAGSRRLTADDFSVSAYESARVLAKVIARIDRTTHSEDRPTLTFVAGQPASGKSRAVSLVKRSLGGPCTTLDSDELRLLHPQMDAIIAADPQRMDVLSNGPVGQWMAGAVEHCRQRRCHTIIENTLTNPDQIRSTAQAFADAGFVVEADILAVPAEVSRLGIVTRYLTGQEKDHFPRWTTEAAHSRAVEGMAPGLRELDGAFDSIRVRDRDGTVLLSSASAPAASDALLEHRSLGLSAQQRQAWMQDYQVACPQVVAQNMVTVQTRTVLGNLLADAERLIPRTELPNEHSELARAVSAGPAGPPRAAEVMRAGREVRSTGTFHRHIDGPGSMDNDRGRPRGFGID